MPIHDRNQVVGGVSLTAKYKGEVVTCDVVDGADGVVFRLADGRDFSSPSAAGSAVMSGVSCNGWRFWSVVGGESPKTDVPATAKASRPAKRQKPPPQIKRLAYQKPTPEGYARWFCSACQKGFLVEGDAVPDSCPAGHCHEPVGEEAA